LILVFGFVGSLLFHFKFPGNQTFTDNDVVILSMFYGLFIFIGIGLTLNSFLFILKNHWKKFRIGVMIFAIGFLIVVFVPRELVVWTLYGEQKSEFTSVNTNESDYT
jgi:hypothetical protein